MYMKKYENINQMVEENLEMYMAIEAFKNGRSVEREFLERNGLQSCVVQLRISYNPNGDDQFFFYNNEGGKWTGEKCEITFKNESEPQIEIFSRRVKIYLMKDAPQATKITFCDLYGKHVTLQDKKSVEEWDFDVNTEFILLS